MAKSKGARALVTLVCGECKNENYRTPKNKTNDPERLELNKLCSKCGKKTAHKEKK